MRSKDRDIIKKCGLDAYFFLRYLQTLLVIFIPIALVVIPVLVPINYVGGIGQSIVSNSTNATDLNIPTGLDTLAWGNVSPANAHRRWAHLILAVLVICWVCFVFFAELRVYIKVRQDYLTSAEHRLRASANTVLVSSIPEKWLTEDALRGLFDVFPGGIRNIWLTRDFGPLLDKIKARDGVHQQLEAAESDLIRMAKKKQLKTKKIDDKKDRRRSRMKTETKAEKLQREKDEDVAARQRAEGPGGIATGDHDEVPQDLDAAVDEADDYDTDMVKDQDMKTQDGKIQDGKTEGGMFGKVPIIGGGLSKVGQGVMKGVTVVGGAGQGILGGAKAFQQGMDGQLTRTGGFEVIGGEDLYRPPTAASTRTADRTRRVQVIDEDDKPKASFASEAQSHASHGSYARGHAHTNSGASEDSVLSKRTDDSRNHGNTTRKAENLDDMFITEETRWWQFWKPPAGGYASPIPQGTEGEEFPFNAPEKSFGQKLKSALPFMGGAEIAPVEYEPASTRDYAKEEEDQPEWQKWVRPHDRPHHRLPLFSWTPSFLPGLPLINKKVDSIYWCRAELARLNLEIEEDQQHPERYPVMKAAFIQFNNQVAAHMACQAAAHHLPKQMTPRTVEIAPQDVIWDNMAINWWDGWFRSVLVMVIVLGMIVLWAFPVAWTASLSNIDALISKLPWLGFLENNPTVFSAVKAIAGVLPAIVLSILLALVPIILNLLAGLQGAKTGSQKTELVQQYYFLFLFVQVFLVVSITSSTWHVISNVNDIGSSLTSTPQILADNLPKAANYFFSYMILQALSTSSGTLLQIGTLFVWYILARLLDSTARAKWSRNVTLPSVTWGSFFPVYTNFACIALIYSVVAPIISIFAIITFSLLWVAHRYNMLYVTRFENDTGGVLYPRAINQTFTGLYVMELCLIGLFFLVTDESGANAGFPQAIVMIVVLVLTVVYQYLLNSSFGPLLRYLPITFEDEAVLRDEWFHRAQERRLGLVPADDEATALNHAGDHGHGDGDEIEMQKLHHKGRTDTGMSARLGGFNPVKGIVTAGGWAVRGGKQIRKVTFGKAEQNLRNVNAYRVKQRQKDLEAQRAIGEALYGGISDEIEDLTPDERDALVRKAFQHYALRARRPTVWIPRDDIGVSDDEVLRTNDFSEHIWISNEYTALDSKVRVVYGRAPPDFSEIDLINL